MSNIYKRTITGVVIIIFIISSILLGKVSFFFLFTLLIYLTLREFFNLASVEHIKPFNYYGSFIGIIVFVMFYVYSQYKINKVDEKIFLPLIPIVISLFLIELYRKNKHPFQNIAYTLFGIIYIAVPFSLFNFFVFQGENEITYHHHFILYYFILVWTYDTTAYLFGMLIGSTPLYSRISPKKTWEGLIGGSVITISLAIFLSKFYIQLSTIDWIVIALIIIVAGTFGDLAESLYKRSLDVKESGSILPGHGGLLDRFDAILFSAPLVFTYLKLVY